jgi:predicted Zn-dependent protease
MLINLASLESSEGHLDLARKHLMTALQRQPDQPFGLIELAAVCIKQNDFREAHELLGKAKQLPLAEAAAYELMTILENKETGQANLLRLRLAARTGCPNWAIEKRYIKLLAETGATAAAVQELRVCLQTQWYRSESWQLLAQLLAKSGDTRGAMEAMALATSYDVHLTRDSAVL